MEADKQTRLQRIFSSASPGWTEVVIGGGFIIILFLIAAIGAYLEELRVVADVRTFFGTIAEQIGIFFDTPLVTNAVTLFFWGLVGLMLYSLLWALCVLFIDIRNDIVTSQYFVHPRSFHKSNFWLALFSRRIILLTAYTVIGVYIVLLLRSLPIVYTSVSDIFGPSISELPTRALATILALGSWLLGWHLIVVVRRLSITLTKEV